MMLILYNFGLTRHLESLTVPGTAVSRLLQAQAGKLYASALQVATLHIVGHDSYRYARGLMLAATNNLALVTSEHSNIKEAEKCIHMIQCMLSDPATLQELPEQEYSFFETNVIAFVETPILSVAPAA